MTLKCQDKKKPLAEKPIEDSAMFGGKTYNNESHNATTNQIDEPETEKEKAGMEKEEELERNASMNNTKPIAEGQTKSSVSEKKPGKKKPSTLESKFPAANISQHDPSVQREDDLSHDKEVAEISIAGVAAINERIPVLNPPSGWQGNENTGDLERITPLAFSVLDRPEPAPAECASHLLPEINQWDIDRFNVFVQVGTNGLSAYASRALDFTPDVSAAFGCDYNFRRKWTLGFAVEYFSVSG